MGIFSAIFGHTKLRTPDREQFFSIIGAAYNLEARTELRPTYKAGVVVNPVESSYFDNLDSEMRTLLDVSGRATGTRFELQDDEFGTRWIILDDPDFEDLVSLIHTITETIVDHGFADRLLAAVFGMEFQGRSAYWLYNYKAGPVLPVRPDREPRARLRHRNANRRDHARGEDPRPAQAGKLVRPLGHTILKGTIYSLGGSDSPSMNSRLGSFSSSEGASLSFVDRPPPPRIR